MALAVGSVLSVALMALHPTAHTHEPAAFVAAVTAGATPNGLVHGGLIAATGTLVFGFWGLACRLGARSVAARAGLVAYAAGAGAMVAAALVSGFIVPEFVSRYDSRPAAELETMQHVLGLARAANQVCSRTGVLAASVAVVFWSAALLHRPGAPRVTGALGLAAGGLPALALLAGYLPMNVHGVLAFALAQAAWGVLAAALLIHGRL